jgi:hypothetical protein
MKGHKLPDDYWRHRNEEGEWEYPLAYKVGELPPAVGVRCSSHGCRATREAGDHLVNIGAYSGTPTDHWLCLEHLPKDWSSGPGSRYHPHEWQAFKDFLSKDENFKRVTKGGRPHKEESDS